MHVSTVKCTHVVVQVNLGYYDSDGNLIGEETFPQSEDNVLTAKLYHPHAERLTHLIEACVQQAWSRINSQAPSPDGAPSVPVAGLEDGKLG